MEARRDQRAAELRHRGFTSPLGRAAAPRTTADEDEQPPAKAPRAGKAAAAAATEAPAGPAYALPVVLVLLAALAFILYFAYLRSRGSGSEVAVL